MGWLNVLCLSVMISGCMSIKTTVTENFEVPAKLAGKDCTPIIFGIGFGENSVTKARSNVHVFGDYWNRVDGAINHVHSVAYTEEYFVFGGNRCVEVVGE